MNVMLTWRERKLIFTGIVIIIVLLVTLNITKSKEPETRDATCYHFTKIENNIYMIPIECTIRRTVKSV